MTSDLTYLKNHLALIKYIDGPERLDFLKKEKDEVSYLFSAGLYPQASLADYEARKNLLSRNGFTSASVEQMIVEMMGDSYTDKKTLRKRHNHNWVCFHLITKNTNWTAERSLIKEDENCTWGSKIERYRRKTLGRFPFQRILHWELWDSKLSQLKLPVSLENAQMISCLKSCKIFSCFGVLAHPDAFKKTDAKIPYLIYGKLWNVLLDSTKNLENKTNAAVDYPLILVRPQP